MLWLLEGRQGALLLRCIQVHTSDELWLVSELELHSWIGSAICQNTTSKVPTEQYHSK